MDENKRIELLTAIRLPNIHEGEINEACLAQISNYLNHCTNERDIANLVRILQEEDLNVLLLDEVNDQIYLRADELGLPYFSNLDGPLAEARRLSGDESEPEQFNSVEVTYLEDDEVVDIDLTGDMITPGKGIFTQKEMDAQKEAQERQQEIQDKENIAENKTKPKR